MRMNIDEYRDKVRACWLGKNIGGTLGTPLEGMRGVRDIDYYLHDISKGVLPNDDLDLQLIWLIAAERFGRGLTADILAEYWLTYIVADWSEYGASKNNLKAGFPVGAANRYKNHNKDSCGCFIPVSYTHLSLHCFCLFSTHRHAVYLQSQSPPHQ